MAPTYDPLPHTTHFDDERAMEAWRHHANLNDPGNATVRIGRALLTLEAERGSLLLRVASLEAAILRWRDTHPWSTRSADISAQDAEDQLWTSLSGSTTALRAMLVEAAKQAQMFECESCGSADVHMWRGSHPQHASGCDGDCRSCPVECGPVTPRNPEAIADRILGASKERGE